MKYVLSNSIGIIIIIIILAACNYNRRESTNEDNSKTDSIGKNRTENRNDINQNLNDWSDLKKYIGTYPKDSNFFENIIIKNELKRILVGDYEIYRKHITKSGCGEINYKYGLIYGDVSQLHVGGYSSLFFINIQKKTMYLFWLLKDVEDKEYKIYGDEPIPANVLNLIEQEMNITWGHVAKFSIQAEKINIELKN